MATRNERKRKARAKREAIDATYRKVWQAVDRPAPHTMRVTQAERIWSKALRGSSSPIACSEAASRAVGTGYAAKECGPNWRNTGTKRFS